MKTFKHTFEEPQLVLINGEVKEVDPKQHEATFSLTVASLLMFEEEYGKPLMKAMTEMIPASVMKDENADFTKDDVISFLDEKFIRALACSCYLKIENGSIINNSISKDEFKNSAMNELCLTDFIFVQQIMTLATQCLYNEKAKKETKEFVSSKPKKK